MTDHAPQQESDIRPGARSEGPLSQLATRGDVIGLYQLLLGREPESEAVITSRVGLSLGAIIQEFLGSLEYQRRTGAALNEQYVQAPPRSDVDLAITEAQRARLLSHIRKTWQQLGRDEALWSVMTNDAFRTATLDQAARTAFFESGQPEVETFLRTCGQMGVDARCEGRVLDFGCGVGRIGVHLAQRYQAYLGVDISQPHLDLAREALTQAGVIDHCQLQRLEDWIDAADGWDAVFSVIVLQHNPPPVIVGLVEVMLRRLNPGGVAWLQIPHALFDYSYSASAHLRALDAGDGRGMEMHPLPQPVMFGLIEDAGCRVRAALADGRAGQAGLSTTYLVTRSA